MIDLSKIVNFGYQTSEHFSMEFRKISRPLMSWRNEVIATALEIQKLAGTRPIIVCMSGGIDGEVVAMAFLEAGIKFSALSCRHRAGTNDHDISNAVSFCKINNIRHHIFEIDHLDFFTNGIDRYIEQGYRATRIFRYFQLRLLEEVQSMGGCAVLGGGDQMYYKAGEDLVLKYAPDFTMVLDWCSKQTAPHVPYFYKQNPNVFAAFMQEPLIDFLINRPKYFRNEWAVSLEKMMVYHAEWPKLKKRRKFTGFEEMLHLKIQKEQELSNKFPEIKDIVLNLSTIKTQLGI